MEKKTIKIAYCIECGKEVPIIISKTKRKKNEVLQIGNCLFCSDEITLVEIVNP